MKRPTRNFLLALVFLIAALPSFAQIALSVSFGPPALPIYEQPLCPAEGYIWTPGYWAWDPDYGYYWIPGTWVLAPEPGYLWTPGWWGWSGAAFVFHEGYWGPHVGFYGGVNYGFGYFGNGFEGGRWDAGRFYYNRSVTNINVTNIHNVYNTTVVNNVTVNRVSYNGGSGGTTARPTPQEESYAQERHLPPIASQLQHVQTARATPELRATANQGRPPIAATDRATSFHGPNVVAAKAAGAPYHPPASPNAQLNRGEAQPAHEPNKPTSDTAPHSPSPTHASQLPPHQVPASPNTANTGLDGKYQQQQKLVDKQNKEHQQLEMQQQKEDDRARQQNYNQQRTQQMEQRHQQQTTQMEQRHDKQTERMQKGQAPPPPRPESRPH